LTAINGALGCVSKNGHFGGVPNPCATVRSELRVSARGSGVQEMDVIASPQLAHRHHATCERSCFVGAYHSGAPERLYGLEPADKDVTGCHSLDANRERNRDDGWETFGNGCYR
jgi:hypothetical protein